MGKVYFKDKIWMGYCIILLCYVIATWIGVTVYIHIDGALWLRVLVADVVATLFVWIISLLFQNASIYDPYWSVQPMVILTLFMVHSRNYGVGAILIYAIIMFWGIRLTSNWAYTFQGFRRQDWRYDLIKERTGRLYQIVNLLGIQLMPTFIVYLCILPTIYYIELRSTFHAVSLIGLSISALGTCIQMIADLQLHTFRNRNVVRSKIIRTGLWRYSRHPNYLGEILMWWGVYLTILPNHNELWYLSLGAIMNTLLFRFISIPMAEKHLAAYKEHYEEYKKETRMLLPFPKKQ
ncbi:DUF1295 domain-containing protein [Mobilitalea sibirica]|uniref:DUF1295 domain-containing protein n=1 Tax=Mobilitalea sibirica TaxID=1462919 RepID=A0A8J7L079_9FIRM|nr:DUF1295 domain-containing protein [Mobilitalea sibirica]MBH1941808.1 DUF1295 domain-containing protein [Mobilitalea sibirica]